MKQLNDLSGKGESVLQHKKILLEDDSKLESLHCRPDLLFPACNTCYACLSQVFPVHM